MSDADVDTEAEFRSKLTPEQYDILRRRGTERPFSGAYVHSKESGMYHCAACGAELFSSETKFDSGTGWPSFTEPATAAAVELVDDSSHGMIRTEVTCKLRLAPRPRLPRRPARRGRHALLHQLALAAAGARSDFLKPRARGPSQRSRGTLDRGWQASRHSVRLDSWSGHARPRSAGGS
jgi:peptide-methionine (R)-S-oxide reductase